MKTFIMSCLVLAACGGTFAQNASEPTTAASTVYVADVYVSTGTGIYGLGAHSDGTLTYLPGSPYKGQVSAMAVTGSELIALDFNHIEIRYYDRGSNGALTLASSINPLAYTGSSCGQVGPMFAIDRTGSTVYPQIYGYGCASNEFRFQDFRVNKTTDQLVYSGVTSQTSTPYVNLAFVENFAVGGNFSTIDEFTHDSTGFLTATGYSFPIPVAPTGSVYLPYLVATDTTNHVFAAFQPVSNGTTGATQIGVYSVASSGMATTSSNPSNMVTVSVGSVKDMEVAPSGKFLCVAGTKGLEILVLHGSGPVTPFGVLTTEPINQCEWDGLGHEYALSDSREHLWVYRPGPTAFTPAPGSPHVIKGLPRGLAVSK